MSMAARLGVVGVANVVRLEMLKKRIEQEDEVRLKEQECVCKSTLTRDDLHVRLACETAQVKQRQLAHGPTARSFVKPTSLLSSKRHEGLFACTSSKLVQNPAFRKGNVQNGVVSPVELSVPPTRKVPPKSAWDNFRFLFSKAWGSEMDVNFAQPNPISLQRPMHLVVSSQRSPQFFRFFLTAPSILQWLAPLFNPPMIIEARG